MVSTSPFLWGPHTATYVYNGAIARLESMTNFTNEDMTFGYAPVTGRDSTRTLPLGNLVETFAHTPWIEGTAAISFNYDDVNLAVGSAYRYDEAQRLTQHFHGRTATPDTTRFATFDRAGRLTIYVDKRYGWSSPACSVRWWSLNPDDPLTRLGETCDYNKLTGDSTLGSATYTYDAVGNRIDSLTQNYAATDAANRLLQWKNFRMSYDADGNLTVKRALKRRTPPRCSTPTRSSGVRPASSIASTVPTASGNSSSGSPSATTGLGGECGTPGTQGPARASQPSVSCGTEATCCSGSATMGTE
jgi:hypothetical protein